MIAQLRPIAAEAHREAKQRTGAEKTQGRSRGQIEGSRRQWRLGQNRTKYRVETYLRGTILGRGPIPPNTSPAIELHRDRTLDRSETRSQTGIRTGSGQDQTSYATRSATDHEPHKPETKRNSQLCRRSPEKERLQNRFRCSPVSPNRNRTPTPSQLVAIRGLLLGSGDGRRHWRIRS